MKLRERIIIFFGVTSALVTLLFVIDSQYELGYTTPRMFPTRHARVEVVETGGDTAEAEKQIKSFQPRPATDGTTTADADNIPKKPISRVEEPHDSFDDLAKLAFPVEGTSSQFVKNPVVVTVFEDRDNQPTLADLVVDMGIGSGEGLLQTKFHQRISKREMYKDDDPLVGQILNEMATNKIIHVQEKEGGTQLKLIIEYESGDRALFKPMRFPRQQQTLENHFYFTDYERHNAEIAAFHLDRILGLRRAMPVTGRLMNLTSELYLVGDANLLKTFFLSPANNYCFHGHCSYYCDTSHAVCGNPDMLEGSFAAFLPEKYVADRTLRKHPWRRSYHKRKKAIWETDPTYCDAVRISPPYNEGTILLDLIDTAMFDFLTGNMDRHHFETFAPFGNQSFPIHLDHGRAFGRPFHDEISILAPLIQCCMIKHTTLAMLLRFHNGEKKLSDLMRESLASDPIAPILWEPHYPAMDRRVKIILETVRDCIERSTKSKKIEASEEVVTAEKPEQKLYPPRPGPTTRS